MQNKRPTLNDKIRVAKWILEDFDATDTAAVKGWDQKFVEYPILSDFCEIRWGSIFKMIESFLKECLIYII